MVAEQSTWHVNDVVAYDLMRELSNSVQAHLLDLVRQGDPAAAGSLSEIRRATFAVDGYDRAAVDAYAHQLQQRDTELARSAANAS